MCYLCNILPVRITDVCFLLLSQTEVVRGFGHVLFRHKGDFRASVAFRDVCLVPHF